MQGLSLRRSSLTFARAARVSAYIPHTMSTSEHKALTQRKMSLVGSISSLRVNSIDASPSRSESVNSLLPLPSSSTVDSGGNVRNSLLKNLSKLRGTGSRSASTNSVTLANGHVPFASFSDDATATASHTPFGAGAGAGADESSININMGNDHEKLVVEDELDGIELDEDGFEMGISDDDSDDENLKRLQSNASSELLKRWREDPNDPNNIELEFHLDRILLMRQATKRLKDVKSGQGNERDRLDIIQDMSDRRLNLTLYYQKRVEKMLLSSSELNMIMHKDSASRLTEYRRLIIKIRMIRSSMAFTSFDKIASVVMLLNNAKAKAKLRLAMRKKLASRRLSQLDQSPFYGTIPESGTAVVDNKTNSSSNGGRGGKLKYLDPLWCAECEKKIADIFPIKDVIAIKTIGKSMKPVPSEQFDHLMEGYSIATKNGIEAFEKSADEAMARMIGMAEASVASAIALRSKGTSSKAAKDRNYEVEMDEETRHKLRSAAKGKIDVDVHSRTQRANELLAELDIKMRERREAILFAKKRLKNEKKVEKRIFLTASGTFEERKERGRTPSPSRA